MLLKKTSIFLCIALVVSLFSSCVYKKGVDYKNYPDRDMPIYDDAVVFEYEDDDDSHEIIFGSSDDVDDVMEFYQEFFEDEDIILSEEKEKKDSYKAEGETEDYTFEIEIEESSGKLEKYYDSVTTIQLEPIERDKKKASTTKVVSSDNLTAETSGGSSITFSEYDITENTKVASKEVEIPFEFSEEVSADDVKITALDYTVENIEEFCGLIEIKIPYDESIMEPGESAAACVSAGYYNEETGEIEPVIYELDEEGKNVIITTDHLSTYCAFTFKNVYKRTATVQLLDYYDMEDVLRLSGVDPNQLIMEVSSNGGEPGELCYEVGFNTVTESLNISAAAATFLSEAITTNEALSSFNDLLGIVGNTAAFAQFAVDIAKGDSEQLYMNTIKNGLGYIIGSIAPLAAVGVYAIDYSLNALGEQIRINDEKIQAGYDKWYSDYEKKQDEHISVRMYKAVESLYGQFKRGEINDLNQAIEDLVRVYTEKIWKEASYVDYFGTTNIESDHKKELSDTAYNKIMRETMQNVFSRAERKIAFYQKMAFLKELKQTRDFLNQKITFNITEVLPNEGAEYAYANCVIRWGELIAYADERTWTGKLNNQGSGKGAATLLGYLQSGAPTYLEVFEPDADPSSAEPVLTVPYEFTMPTINIELKQDSNPFIGEWSRGDTIETTWGVYDLTMTIKVTIDFNEDMTGYLNAHYTEVYPDKPNLNNEYDQGGDFTYSYDETTLVLTLTEEGTQNIAYIIEGDNLSLEESGEFAIYTKVE